MPSRSMSTTPEAHVSCKTWDLKHSSLSSTGEASNQQVEWLRMKANAQRWQLTADITGGPSPNSPEPKGGGIWWV